MNDYIKNFFNAVKSKYELLLDYLEDHAGNILEALNKFFKAAFIVFGAILGIRLLFSGSAFVGFMGLCMLGVVVFLSTVKDE